MGSAVATERKTFSTICSFCGTGCSLDVHVEDGHIVDVRGAKDGPVNHGETCVKGLQAWKYVQSDKRLRYPLVRKDGNLVRATWDEALTRIVEAIQRLKASDGPDAFGCLSSSRATNEMNFVAQKFMRQVIGTNNIDSCNRT